jgi:hypothetical protein
MPRVSAVATRWLAVTVARRRIHAGLKSRRCCTSTGATLTAHLSHRTYTLSRLTWSAQNVGRRSRRSLQTSALWSSWSVRSLGRTCSAARCVHAYKLERSGCACVSQPSLHGNPPCLRAYLLFPCDMLAWWLLNSRSCLCCRGAVRACAPLTRAPVRVAQLSKTSKLATSPDGKSVMTTANGDAISIEKASFSADLLSVITSGDSIVLQSLESITITGVVPGGAFAPARRAVEGFA